MMKSTVIRSMTVLSVLLLVAALLVSCAASASHTDPSAGATEQAAQAIVNKWVIAEGHVVPRHHVDLRVASPGTVAEVFVSEGEAVSAGQILLRLDDGAQQAAVAQVQAGVDAAIAALEALETGPRAEQIAVAEAAVSAARAHLELAQAQVEHTRLGVDIAKSQVRSAQAGLDDLLAGPAQSERDIMAKQVELARNELWASQGYRDGVKGAYERKQAKQYDVDQAEAAVGMAYVSHEIAAAQAGQLAEAPRDGLIAQAQAAVSAAAGQRDQALAAIPVAEAQVAQAEAAVAQARAQADLARVSATEQQLDQAQAAVAQARAQLVAAQVALQTRTLTAPAPGVLTTLSAKVGEELSGLETVARLADLAVWEIETEDLTEIEVVYIEVGQQVTVRPDALPEIALQGTVMAISDDYAEQRGDITYRVRIRLDETDPRLRWGMTVEVTFR